MSNYKPPTLKSQQKLVEKINAAYNTGDKVYVKLDTGKIVVWTIKAPASLLGGHTAVIWIDEHSSCYSADRVLFRVTFKQWQQSYPDAINFKGIAAVRPSITQAARILYGHSEVVCLEHSSSGKTPNIKFRFVFSKEAYDNSKQNVA
jgi:hypothetical protein